MSIGNPNCPTDCSGVPAKRTFDACAPSITEGQIHTIYIAAPGNPFIDWTDAAEWLSRISNTSTNANAIRELKVIGSKPAAEVSEVEISGKRTVVLNKTHTLDYKIDETNTDNWEALRELECNSSYVMWFANGDKLQGGLDGIALKSLRENDVIPESYKDLETFVGQAKWESIYHPNRIDNPML